MAIQDSPDQEDLQLTLAQRVPLTIYCCIVTFFGLFGNGTVLYSSVRYNAIRLDRVSVILVQNLAVADILYTLCTIVPVTITYICGRWVLGRVYCFIGAQLAFIPGSANSQTILLITSFRLWLVTHPLSVVSKFWVRIMVIAIWIIASSGSVISISYNSTSAFNPRNGKCASDVYDNLKGGIALGIILVLPLIITTIQNAFLCAIAMKTSRSSQDNTNYKALVMVCVLSGVFILSYIPLIIYSLMKSKDQDISPNLELVTLHCFMINAFVNPILYTLTNKRFGEYVKDLLKAFISCGTERNSGRNPVISFRNSSAVGSASATE